MRERLGHIWSKLEPLRKVVAVIVVFFILMVTVGPALGPGAASTEKRLPDEPVTDCVEPPHRPVSENATIVGHVERISNRTVAISYEAVNEPSENVSLEVRLPRYAERVNTTGFIGDDDGEIILGGAPLQWNHSASNHVVRYRMTPLSSDAIRIPRSG